MDYEYAHAYVHYGDMFQAIRRDSPLRWSMLLIDWTSGSSDMDYRFDDVGNLWTRKEECYSLSMDEYDFYFIIRVADQRFVKGLGSWQLAVDSYWSAKYEWLVA
jgi:hypothetical protein